MSGQPLPVVEDDWLESLWLGPTVYAQLVSGAKLGGLHGGHEACGVIFGHRALDAGVRRGLVMGSARLRNVAKEPEHTYEFDPAEQARCWERIRAMRLEVLGVWHSHPSGPAHPSQTDIEYMQPWLVYPVLVPVREGRAWEMTCYRLVAEADRTIGYAQVPHEVRLTGVGSPSGPARHPL